MELDDFRDELINQVNTRASIEGVWTEAAFVTEAANLLISADEVDNVDLLAFRGLGRRGQALAVHGYQFDEQDKSVSLVVAHKYGGKQSVPTITHTEAASTLKSLEQFLKEALTGDFQKDREPSTPEYQLAQTLQELHFRKGDGAVSRFRLYLVTDAKLSSRAKVMESTTVIDTPTEFHVWDMQRFFQVHESSRGREPLELDLGTSEVGGVPALKVSDGADDITTYLAAVPGKLLASLYQKHGSRLLEGNVRSFLTIRGKINKGIRDTIMKEPRHFLAYNNGISATASSVEFADGVITKITDLQIVNGGQTTASLFYASQVIRDLPLDNVFVQMKLVVVSPEDALEMVPMISRYANSQNAVREDDFFSNSPFHIQMEELSRRVLDPVKAGVSYRTKWYYERTRGQYLNELNRSSPAAQKTFAAEFPRSQVITKTDAAKYVVAWERQPHQVSAGAQKNFKAFAALVAEKYAKEPEVFNAMYYQRLVAKALLFNSVRTAISKSDWYEPGYLANLTAYAVAKLSHEISREPRAGSFDLRRIWEAQAVGEATLNEAVAIARIALDVLTGPDRLVVNVTEWAKREAAWKLLAHIPYTLSDPFILECIPVKLNSTGKVAATINSRFPADMTENEHVREIDANSWREIERYLADSSSLTGTEKRLLLQVTSGINRMLDIDVARDLLHLYVKAINAGWPEGASTQ